MREPSVRGSGNRILVETDGLSREDQAALSNAILKIDGVTAVQGAGGQPRSYFSFDRRRMDMKTARDMIAAVAREMTPTSADMPSSIMVSPDEPPTADSTEITADSDLTIEELLPSGPIASSSWTGIASIHERVAAVKAATPVALMAIDALIDQLEVGGANGGPPLDERREAIDDLRKLHNALGALLEAVERPSFEWAEGEGLLAACEDFAKRSAEKLTDDPVPFGVAALILTLLTVFGQPGIGGFLASVSLAMQKKAR
jgi:hypothetical protein